MQPAINHDAIELIVNHRGKKTHGELAIARAKKAIKKLKKQDYVEGLAFEALLLDYLNECDRALEVIEEAKKLSTDSYLVASADFNICRGDWGRLKTSLQNFLNIAKYLDDKDKSSERARALSLSLLYLDTTLMKEIINTPEFVRRQDEFDELLKEVDDTVQELSNLDISLELYRKVISLIYQTTSEDYSIDILITTANRDNYLDVYCYCDLDVEDIYKLNAMLAERISEEFADTDDMEKVMKLNPMYITNNISKEEFNFDLERMEYMIDTDFVEVPSDLETLADFDKWLSEA